MIATPKSEMKPTAAEMLKCVPVSQQRPDAAHRQGQHVGQHHEANPAGLRKAMYSRTKITPSESGITNIKRPSACFHFLELAAPHGAVGSGRRKESGRLAWASATAPARSRSRTLNLTAIRRCRCSR